MLITPEHPFFSHFTQYCETISCFRFFFKVGHLQVPVRDIMELECMAEVFRQTCHSRWRQWCQGLVASLAIGRCLPRSVWSSLLLSYDAANASWDGGVVKDSARKGVWPTTSYPEMCCMSVVNCAIKPRRLNFRGEQLSRFCWKAKVIGLWSMKITNNNAACGRNTLRPRMQLEVLDRKRCIFVELSFLEKNPRSWQTLSTRYCSTAPMAEVTSTSGVAGSGCPSKVARSNLGLHSSKALWRYSVQAMGWEPSILGPERVSWSGAWIAAAWGRNRL
jgi:hypothetical protein